MLSKVLLSSLLVTPAVLGATLFANSAAIASDVQGVADSADALTTDVASSSQEDAAFADVDVADDVTVDTAAPAQFATEVQIPTQLAQVSVEEAAPATSTPSVSSLEQINQYASEGGQDSLGQVTSISQLSDVQPTDWAFQALQSLVERYGVIAGYPDGTYRGNRALTRYEFAAGLNAALDRVNELIAAGLADAVTAEDLATLQRLQEEFAAELATLRGRVDALEARTAELEANQFSTTTVLRGEAIFNVAGVIEEDDALFEESQITFGYRVRLNLDTSFTGEDLLRTRLQARNIQDFDSDPIGFSYSGDSDGDIVLDDLVYTFPVGERLQFTIGANSIAQDDFVTSTISPLDSSGGGSLSNFGFPPQYGFPDAGNAGAGVIVQLTDNLSLDLGYSAGEANDPSEGAGLFNGDYSAIGQLTYLTDTIDAAVTYTHAYSGDGFLFDAPEVINAYGAQVNFKLFDGFEFGGGAMYAPVRTIGEFDSRVWSYQGTLAFPDLGGEGNLLGILVGVPPRLADNELFGSLIEDASLVVEGFYRYRVNDNISITPGVIWYNDPFNENDIDDTIIGAIRTTFTF